MSDAFVGVSTVDPVAYARLIQKAVLDRTHLHCSVGIGDTLIRAKNATDFGKPRGVFRLTAQNWFDVIGERPTRALWGVGSKISQRLSRVGITTVNELASTDESVLTSEFGPKMGLWYRQLARGDGSTTVDDTPWVARGRGHGHETTFQKDIVKRGDVERAARELFAQVWADVEAEAREVIGVGVKVRYASFVTKTFVHKIAATSDRDAVFAEAMTLVDRLEPARPIRLLGVRAELAMPTDSRDGHTPTRGGW